MARRGTLNRIDLLPATGGGSAAGNLLNAIPKGVGLCEACGDNSPYTQYGLPTDTSLRAAPTRIIVAAYGDVLRSAGEFVSLSVLREEICAHAAKYSMSECLADALTDCKTNAAQAARLSRATWQRLKEELAKMMAYSESKLAKFSMEEFRKYGVFDEWGTIIGVKEDAPDEFKEAYEHDKEAEDL